MAWKTPDQHRTEAALAVELIETGRVRSWAGLGREFEISGQAAHARFGPKGYGIRMPPRVRQERRMVSVSLDQALNEMVGMLQDSWPGPRPSRAQVVRSILERELPLLAFPPQFAA